MISSNFEEFIKLQESRTLLRLITCGSVDDGKSTLIGRLLHDSRSIFEDQLRSLELDSKKCGNAGNKLDFSLLVDGLQSEREQGITIDVAYRYFATNNRKFIIADTPGHEQYTRNMATGASTADLAIILIDARLGVLAQTKRHSYIATLLGIKHIVIAVNKMDLVNYDKTIFNNIKKDYLDIVSLLPSHTDLKLKFIPICAIDGDNIVNKSNNIEWYHDETILEYLDNIFIGERFDTGNDFRLPVQFVNRPHLDFRGICGTIASGSVKVGDSVIVLPSQKVSVIDSLITSDIQELDGMNLFKYHNEASANMSVTVTLKDELDICRGDVIVNAGFDMAVADSFSAMVVWMSDKDMEIGGRYILKRASTIISASVISVEYKKDINTLSEVNSSALGLNDIGRCNFALDSKMAFDSYNENRQMGSFIIIDKYTNETLAAGMIIDALIPNTTKTKYSKLEILLNRLIRKYYPHWEAKDIAI